MLSERSIWYQALRDILTFKTIPRSHPVTVLPFMSTEQLVRVCIVAYRLNQYLYTSQKPISLVPEPGFRCDSDGAGIRGFILGGDYFMLTEEKGTVLNIHPVISTESKLELLRAPVPHSRLSVVALRCISLSTYRLAIYSSYSGPP